VQKVTLLLNYNVNNKTNNKNEDLNNKINNNYFQKLDQKTKDYLTIVHWNANSLDNKNTEFENFLVRFLRRLF
jgi:hypothetical protein